MRWILEGTLATIILLAGVFLFLKAPDLVRGWAFRIPGTTDVALEPDFFPRVASVLMALSAILVIATIPMRTDALPAAGTSLGAYLRAGAGLAGVLVYLLCVVFFGFVVSTVCFIIVASMAGGYGNLLVLIPTAIIVAIGLRLVFRFGLHVGLPEGMLI